MKRIITFLFFSLSCFYGQTSEALKTIDQILLSEYNQGHFSGSITIGNSNHILYEKQLGIANRTWQIPIEKNTRFDIASINKSFIAALVLIAVEERHFTLKSKLRHLLDNLELSNTFDQHITIHQLLSHTSGLADYNSVDSVLAANNFRKFKRSHFSNEEYVFFINQLTPIGAPGAQFHYSNFAYHLLCILLEETYQQTFNEILQSKICEPLGLKNTINTTDNTFTIDRLALGYQYKNHTWHTNDFIDLTLGRRIFSTSEDLYKWAHFISSDKLLSQASQDLMFTNHVKTAEKIAYGYGWVPYPKGASLKMGNLSVDEPYFIHGGNTGGYRSLLVNVNDGEYIISILGNIGNRLDEIELTKIILNQLLNS